MLPVALVGWYHHRHRHHHHHHHHHQIQPTTPSTFWVKWQIKPGGVLKLLRCTLHTRVIRSHNIHWNMINYSPKYNMITKPLCVCVSLSLSLSLSLWPHIPHFPSHTSNLPVWFIIGCRLGAFVPGDASRGRWPPVTVKSPSHHQWVGFQPAPVMVGLWHLFCHSNEIVVLSVGVSISITILMFLLDCDVHCWW